MKKRMNSYINELCGSDLDALKKIITTQYKQFIHFYRLVENLSDDICSLYYQAKNDDTLSVDIRIISTLNPKDVLENLKSKTNDVLYGCDIHNDGDIISISLRNL